MLYKAGCLHIRSVPYGEEKNLFRCQEILLDHAARSVVTVLTELPRLPRSVCGRLIGLSEHN